MSEEQSKTYTRAVLDGGETEIIICAACGTPYDDWTFNRTDDYEAWTCPCGACHGVRFNTGALDLGITRDDS